MPEEYEVSLTDYLMVLWREKWIVIVTFAVAIAAALLAVSQLPAQYQVETSLLIFPPLAQDVAGQVAGTVYSPETYKSLALAGDLLKEVIDAVYAEGENERRPTVSELEGRMKVGVEEPTQASSEDSWPGRFPLRLWVDITGTDPVELQHLAEVWVQRFTARNAELFTSRTAQSYEYIQENFNQVEQELKAKEEERKRFQQENQLEVLQAEVTVLQGDYQAYLDQLWEKRKELSSKEATLAGLQEAIAQEPVYLVLQRSVSSDALWNFLAQGASPKELSALPSLTLEDQQLNSVYMTLRSQLASAQVDVKTLREEIAYLESAVETTKASLEEKRAQMVSVQMEFERLDREISILENSYMGLAGRLQEARIAKAETGEPIKVIELPVVPTTPIGSRKTMNVAVAGVLGLFLGILLAFVANAIKSRDTGAAAEEETQPGSEPLDR